MGPDLANLTERYEASRRALGRLRVLWVLVLVTLVGIGEAYMHWLRPAVTFTCGALLAALVYWASVRGMEAWRGVRTGAIAGVLPLFAALGAESVGMVCTPAGCSSLCVPACAISGCLAAAWIVKRGYGRARAEFWITAGAAATAVGALGCACVSYTGAFALAVAMLLALGTGAIFAPRPALQ
jgi:hypothetical protein